MLLSSKTWHAYPTQHLLSGRPCRQVPFLHRECSGSLPLCYDIPLPLKYLSFAFSSHLEATRGQVCVLQNAKCDLPFIGENQGQTRSWNQNQTKQV